MLKVERSNVCNRIHCRAKAIFKYSYFYGKEEVVMELTAVFYHYKIYLALIQTQFTKSLQKYTKLAGQLKKTKKTAKSGRKCARKKSKRVSRLSRSCKAAVSEVKIG